ncbi:hypothetical protein J2755_000273 [Methanohalophilus levihalophilus]|nr:hypothetical protein [Methanohalophilus levihalophilus]
MSCGLSKDSLFVLNILYSKRCVHSSRGFHCDKLKHIMMKKTSTKFKDIMKELINEGYVSKLSKKEDKYFISDMKKAMFALGEHDFNVTKGKERIL